MPRISAEKRAAAMWQVGGKSPSAPKHLSTEERQVWDEIVASKPVDFFRPGATILLEQFCALIVLARKLAPQVAENPADASVAMPYLKILQQCAAHATKLRLTIQTSVHRRSGILDEPGPSQDPHGLLRNSDVDF